MKKYFIFALAALTLTFVACDPNKQNNPTDPTDPAKQDTTNVDPSSYDAKDYVGTQWITDSTLIEGEGLSPAPHAYIYVVSETEVEINGWPCNYRIDSNILYLHTEEETPIPLKIISADKEHAALLWEGFQGDGADGLIHMTRVEEPQGDALPVTKENIAGKWRLMYSKSIETSLTNLDPEYEPYVIIHGMPGEEIYDFKADGSLVKTNSFDRIWDAQPETGWWEVKNDQLFFATGTPDYPAVKPDPIPADWGVSVSTLTGNVMKTYKYETFTDYSMEYINYFVRVK